MLNTAEQSIRSKPSHVLMINKGREMKRKGKGKAKARVANRPNVQGRPKMQVRPQARPQHRPKAPKEGVCFHCNKPGHWKRNCKLYLDELKKKKSNETTSSSGIYVVEINLSTYTSWEFDTGCGSHICTNV